MRICTIILSSSDDPLVISAVDGVLLFSCKVNASSTGTLLGNITFVHNPGTNQVDYPAAAQDLAAGDGVILSAPNPKSPVDGVTLTCTGGTINVLIGF